MAVVGFGVVHHPFFDIVTDFIHFGKHRFHALEQSGGEHHQKVARMFGSRARLDAVDHIAYGFNAALT